MPKSTQGTLADMDLAELEMAFAKDPSSDAFLALSQAYLEQGRFMEAMVVCKKGIRGQPESTEGRLLLAKVYAGQGKVPKAIDEVKSLLELDDSIAEAHFFLGQLHERSGRFEEAIDAFKEALVIDRHHAGAQEALSAKGIAFDPGPSPEELEAQRLAEEEAARQAAEEEARLRAEADAQRQAEEQAAIAQATGVPMTNPGMSSPGFAQPDTGATPAVGSVPPQHSGVMQQQVGYNFGGYDPLAQQAEASKKKLGLGFSFGLFAILLFVVAGLILFLRANKEEAEAIAALSKEAQKPFIGETTYGLRRAAKKYEEILEIDDGHEVAIARLAWIHQTLGLERGDRAYLENAEKALLLAQKKAAGNPLTVAAGIVRKVNLGQAAEALKVANDYEAKHDNLPLSMKVAKGKALIANGQMQSLEPILQELKKADRPGPLHWAGSTWRRLGDELEAAIALDNAIKYEPDHDPSRAERALLLLEIRDLGRVDVVLADLQHLSDLGKAQLGPVQDGYASLARAEINRLLEKEDIAKTNMESAQKKLTRNAELLAFEARWAFARDAHALGIEKLQKSLDIDPHRVRPWKVLIEEAASKKASRDQASEAFDKAQKIFGDHGLLVEARVELLGRQRKLGDAAKYLDELKGKPGVAPEVFREIGRIQLAKRDYTTAIATLEDAVKKVSRRPKLTKASTLTLLGRAHAANDDHGKAIDAYKEAIQAAGSYAPAYFYLARSLQANEQAGAAKEAYLRASKLDPTSSMGRAAKKAAEKL